MHLAGLLPGSLNSSALHISRHFTHLGFVFTIGFCVKVSLASFTLWDISFLMWWFKLNLHVFYTCDVTHVFIVISWLKIYKEG